jgi:hypothetical protein
MHLILFSYSMEIEGEKTTIPDIIRYANAKLAVKTQPPTNEDEITRAIDVFNIKNGRDLMQSSTKSVLMALDEVVDTILKKRGTFQEPPKTITVEALLEKIHLTSSKRYTIEELKVALEKWKTQNGKDFLTLLMGSIGFRLPEIITLLNKKGGSRRKSRRKRRKSVRR